MLSCHVAQHFVFVTLLQMRLVAQVLLCFLAFISLQAVLSDCTRGHLFVADADSAKVRACNIDGSDKPALINAIETVSGLGPQHLRASLTCGAVAALCRGKTENSWQDCAASFVRVGVSPNGHVVEGFAAEKEDPSLVDGFCVNCTRPIHRLPHDKKIGGQRQLHCMGF
jgi:hypothetical protein